MTSAPGGAGAPSRRVRHPGGVTSDGPGARPRLTYANGRATREQLLLAATALFAEVGYHAASLREVAARAGVSHPGLLHHFPSKAALLAAVLEQRDEQDDVALQVDVAAGVDPLTALAHLVERNTRRPDVVQLFVTLSAEATARDHPAHDFFRRRYADLVVRVEQYVQALAVEDRLRDGIEPHDAARLLVAAMDGLQVQWLLAASDGTPVDMVGAFRTQLRALVLDG